MKQLVFFSLIVCWMLTIQGSSSAQIPATNNYDPSSEWSVEQLKEDFAYFKTAMNEIHPALYRFSSKLEIDKAFDVLEKTMSGPLTDAQLSAAFAQFFSVVGCAHTFHLAQINRYRWLERHGKYLPLEVRICDERLFVSRNLSGLNKIQIDQEIMAINGWSSKELIDSLLLFITADGHHKEYKKNQLENNFGKLYHAYLQASDTFEIDMGIYHDGVFDPYTVIGKSLDELEQERNRQTENNEWPSNTDQSIQRRMEGKVAVLKIASFGNPDHPTSARDFRTNCHKAFRDIEKEGVEYLIIDVRGNEGGSVELQRLLCSYILEEDTTLKQQLHVKCGRTPEWYLNSMKPTIWQYPEELLTPTDTGFNYTGYSTKKLKKPKNFFKGKLYVLQDIGTYSAAADFVLNVQLGNRGQTVGEQTGGIAGGNNAGEVLELKLPNTKGKVFIPLVSAYYQIPSDVPENEGLSPDYIIPLNFHNCSKEEDDGLHFILEQIRTLNQ